jgi:Na+-transporting NADH:ubiquinone oxidoreductase subunit NqrB
MGIMSGLLILGVISGIAVITVTDTRNGRITGAVIIAAVVIGWLFSLLPYLAAQAIARYISWHVEE